MSTAWVRLSRTCQNDCVFCVDADVLDGTVVDFETVSAEIDAAAAAGHDRVVLSGGEPTLSKHLIKAIKHAKAAGLTVALTTNGRIVKSDAIAKALESAGLDEIHVSVHSGRRTHHDQLTRTTGSWVESLAGLRFCDKTAIRSVMKAVLTPLNKDDLGHLMHLATMGGAKGFELRMPEHAGAAAAEGVWEHLHLPVGKAAEVLGELWYDAKEEVLDFRGIGFDDTLDEGIAPQGEQRQADAAALRLLRKRAYLPQAGLGFTVLGDEGLSKDLVGGMKLAGGLKPLGLELSMRGAPIADAPWCVGGRPADPEAWGEAVHYAEACEGCPMRPRCPGVPKKLTRKVFDGDLAPLPAWTGVAEGKAVVCGGTGDDLLVRHTLPALAEALSTEGLDATYAEVPGPLDDVALVVVGDAETAAAVLAQRPEGQRVVFVDASMGADLARLPAMPDLVVSWTPERVDGLVAAGLPLDRVDVRPYPVPPQVTGTGAPAGPVVCVGDHADWAHLEQALLGLPVKRPPFVVFDTEANPAPTLAGVARHTDADDDAILQAILGARALVYATPRDRAPTARDLRWFAVAQAAGRPVVAMRGPSVADQVHHGVTGWLVPKRPGRPLVEGLRQVTADLAAVGRAGAQARQAFAHARVEAWAHDLVHGRLPTSRVLVATKGRPWPPL